MEFLLILGAVGLAAYAYTDNAKKKGSPVDFTSTREALRGVQEMLTSGSGGALGAAEIYTREADEDPTSNRPVTQRPGNGREAVSSFSGINSKGLALVKRFEGFYANPYRDPVGVWTIGYGHTNSMQELDVGPNTPPLSERQASEILERDLNKKAVHVRRLVKVPLTSNEFSALVSWTFNLGQGNLSSSTLLRKLNSGDYSGAANEFPKWNRAGDQVLRGLTRRRADEKKLFLEDAPHDGGGPIARTGNPIPSKVAGQWPSWAPEPLSTTNYIAANHYSDVKSSDWPARHFSPREIATPWNGSNGSLIVKKDALRRLDRLREAMGQPLKLNSGYRDPAKNSNVGGAAQSRHMLGWAFDISNTGMNQATRRKLAQKAREVGFGGIGYYGGFLHVDVANVREWGHSKKGLYT